MDLMRGRRRDLDLEAYSESLYPERLGCSSLRALRDGRFKLIDAPRPELYDLERDPFEERNIYDERRALAEAMIARAAVVAKGRGSAPAPEGRTRVTPELQARLARWATWVRRSHGTAAARACPTPRTASAPTPANRIPCRGRPPLLTAGHGARPTRRPLDLHGHFAARDECVAPR